MLGCWEDQFIHLFMKPFASVCFLPVPTLGAEDPAKRGKNPFPRGPLRSGNIRLESGITIRGPEEPSKGCRNRKGDMTVGRGRQRSISRWCICWVFNNVYEFSRKRKGECIPGAGNRMGKTLKTWQRTPVLKVTRRTIDINILGKDGWAGRVPHAVSIWEIDLSSFNSVLSLMIEN